MNTNEDLTRKILIVTLDIQTHHDPTGKSPWLAIPMRILREIVYDRYGAKCEEKTVSEIMNDFRAVLDEVTLIFSGETETEAVNSAIAWWITREIAP